MSRDALVVGINNYSYLSGLNAPAIDAEAIAQRLQQHGEFRNVVRLPETIQTQDDRKTAILSEQKSVSQQQLETALEHLFLPKSNQAPETALFYFSGHGLSDSKGYDKGYLATSETHPNNPRSGLSLRWLQWLLSESKVKQQIVWLDCCHSGGLIINVGAANPGHGESRDRCFIASSRDFENSWTDLNSPYSVLTKALLDGLDPRRLSGEWIDTFSLVDYVNKALRGELQTPVCTNFGEAINLTRGWQVQAQADGKHSTDLGICPYKGLEYFDCNDTDPKYFFGRDRLVSQLLDQVRTSNFMALVGASGNGKSSVLRAGLLHQIKMGRRIAGSDQWRIRITRPDRQPMQNLALAFVDDGLSDIERARALGQASDFLKEGPEGLQQLIQASSAPRVILVIDQFEEVFTRCEDKEEREHYFTCLMGALSDTDHKLCLIIAMRADFIGKCLERKYGGLAQQVQQHMISVLPMEPNGLKEAICNPAEQVGLTIEPTLATEILNDISGAPGSLPLLQYTLKELYQQRQGNQLVLMAYQALGGITGTLDKRATHIYNSFDKDQQLTVQHVFQQLTQLGEGTEDTRRRVFQSDLVAEPNHSAQQVQEVIQTLSSPENRLLVTSEVVSKNNESERMAIVDVAHEALIRHWRLLRQWIEQNRDLLRQQRKIEASAMTWREQGQERGYLLQGRQLSDAKEFRKQHAKQFPLSKRALVFLQKSLRWQQLNRLKWLVLLVIPAFLADYSFHTFTKIDPYYRQLDRDDKQAEKSAVLHLISDCGKTNGEVTGYFIERFQNQYCRPLEGKDLRDADLRDAGFSYANLSHAFLGKADLSHAFLNDADLSHAMLSSANLSSAFLSKADLSKALLGYADLSYAFLSDADLSKADLDSAFLNSAFLSGADLSGANLNRADLSYADFHDADLHDADLSKAIILAAELSNSKNLTEEQLSEENHPYLCNVNLPRNITGINPDRDCDDIPQLLSDRYGYSLEDAQQIVDHAKPKTWD